MFINAMIFGAVVGIIAAGISRMWSGGKSGKALLFICMLPILFPLISLAINYIGFNLTVLIVFFCTWFSLGIFGMKNKFTLLQAWLGGLLVSILGVFPMMMLISALS